MPIYATFDPSNWKGANVALSNGNLTATGSHDTTGRTVRATIPITDGKWYWEIHLDSGLSCIPGFEVADCNLYAAGAWPGWVCPGWGYIGAIDGAAGYMRVDGTLTPSTSLTPTFSSSSVVMFAYDADSGLVWIGVDGVWINSGNPAAGTNSLNPSYPYTTDGYFAVVVSNGDVVTANFGASAFEYSVPSGFNSGIYASTEGEIVSGVGISDDVSGYALSEVVTDGFSINDQTDAFSLTDGITDAAELNDSILGLRETDLGISDASGIADATERNLEASEILNDATGIADAMSVFNWQQWLEQYGDNVVTRYYFTLTGDADGVSDAVIPISSFSYRRRNGGSSYLSVVIPSMEYSTIVTARANGDMKLEVAYLFAGIEVLREEIITVDLESIRTDEGARSESISLSGHRTEAFGGQICTPRGINYRSNTDGKWLLRCQPDPYLRPGDTIRVNGVDLFTADNVSAYVSGNSVSMEVSES
jgi:hypothetical protein